MVSIYFSPKFNTKNIKTIDQMFYGCYFLTSVNLSNFNTSNIINMEYLFENCHL